MTVQNLIRLVNTPMATLALPNSLDLSAELDRDFFADWKASESRRTEIGRTLKYVPTTTGYTITLSAPAPGDPSGRFVDIPDLKGNDQFADFHTHPTDPDRGNVFNHWIYQPPSLADVISIATKHTQKPLFISFVAVSGYEVYAVVYLKTVTNSDANLLAESDGDSQTDMLNFVLRLNNTSPQAWQNFKYEQYGKKTPGFDAVKVVQERLDKMTMNCSGAGSENARLMARRLFDECHRMQFGLYKGKSILHRVNAAPAAAPYPKGYSSFLYMTVY
jgi:hypothetical protein